MFKIADFHVRNDIFEGLSGPIESKHLLISMLLPPVVKAFFKELKSWVEQGAGLRLDLEARRPKSSLEITKWIDRARNCYSGPSRTMDIRAVFSDLFLLMGKDFQSTASSLSGVTSRKEH
jgi:hypothetical protein